MKNFLNLLTSSPGLPVLQPSFWTGWIFAGDRNNEMSDSVSLYLMGGEL